MKKGLCLVLAVVLAMSCMAGICFAADSSAVIATVENNGQIPHLR